MATATIATLSPQERNDVSLEVGSFLHRIREKALGRGTKSFLSVDRSKRQKNKRRETASAEKARVHRRTPDEGGSARRGRQGRGGNYRRETCGRTASRRKIMQAACRRDDFASRAKCETWLKCRNSRGFTALQADDRRQRSARAATAKARRTNVQRSVAQARRASNSHAGRGPTQSAIGPFPSVVASLGLPLHELPAVRLRLRLGAHLRDQLLHQADVLRFVAAPALQITLVHRLAEIALFAFMLVDIGL